MLYFIATMAVSHWELSRGEATSGHPTPTMVHQTRPRYNPSVPNHRVPASSLFQSFRR